MLWYVKGSYDGGIVYDFVEAPPDPDGTDKEYHVWGQSVEGVKEILRRLSKDGDTVCDIMCGGGSTVVAALELGVRRVIACDVDIFTSRLYRSICKQADNTGRKLAKLLKNSLPFACVSSMPDRSIPWVTARCDASSPALMSSMGSTPLA